MGTSNLGKRNLLQSHLLHDPIIRWCDVPYRHTCRNGELEEEGGSTFCKSKITILPTWHSYHSPFAYWYYGLLPFCLKMDGVSFLPWDCFNQKKKSRALPSMISWLSAFLPGLCNCMPFNFRLDWSRGQFWNWNVAVWFNAVLYNITHERKEGERGRGNNVQKTTRIMADNGQVKMNLVLAGHYIFPQD